MNYQDAYVRNIGVFTEAEQEMLRNAKVTIAGLGGVGGYEAVALARYGIGELSLMDPGSFDPPDMNRQYGASEQTMGKNKAEVMREKLSKVNPFMKINISSEAILDSGKLERFMEGSALVMDAIDAFVFDQREIYAQVARKLGVYNINCGVDVGKRKFSAVLAIFDPEGEHLEDIFRDFKDPPRPVSQEVCTNMLTGAWAAFEAAAIITGKKKKDEIVVAPYHRDFNLFTGKSRYCQWI